MTDQEIYKLWLSRTSDHRYLRPKRWNVMKDIVISNKVQSVIEFGCGVSSLLFSNLGLRVLSYETDSDFIAFTKDFRFPRINFIKWDNNSVRLPGKFDFAFVDGILPRQPQLLLAQTAAPLIAVDDYAGALQKRLEPLLKNATRIDDCSTILAVFKFD